METILDRIIEQKKKEVQILQDAGFKRDVSLKRPINSFIQRLESADSISIISEFKRSSPSKGVINHNLNPNEQARIYEECGASAISVLTDETFFKGSFEDLKAVRETVDLPVLCKDFIIDPVQIDMAYTAGADIILLIVAALDQQKLKELYEYAASLNLEVLVEVHNLEELKRALQLNCKLIGVNNRDLKTFTVSLTVTEQLASMIKHSGAFLISESGIQSREDVERVVKAGAKGILVGESLMKSLNVKQSFIDFQVPLIEGVKNEG